jgi:hypothetical protein
MICYSGMRVIINLVCRLHISNLREQDPEVRLRHVKDPQPPVQKRAGHQHPQLESDGDHWTKDPPLEDHESLPNS